MSLHVYFPVALKWPGDFDKEKYFKRGYAIAFTSEIVVLYNLPKLFLIQILSENPIHDPFIIRSILCILVVDEHYQLHFDL